MGLLRYASFQELFTFVGIKRFGWTDQDTIESAIQDMRKYYSKDEEKECGVLGIHIKPV